MSDELKRALSASIQTALHELFQDVDTIEVIEVSTLATQIRVKRPEGGLRYFMVRVSEQL